MPLSRRSAVSLLLATAFLPLAATAAHAQGGSSTLHPYAICSQAGPSGLTLTLYAALNTGTQDVAIDAGLQNYFSPGPPDQGQITYFPVGMSESFPVTIRNFGPGQTISWMLAGNTVAVSSSDYVPCSTPFLQPTALAFSATGTYPHQFLGTVANAIPFLQGAAIALTPNAPLTVANTVVSTTPPVGTTATGDSQTAYLYGDVTVTGASATPIPLAVTLSLGQTQTTLAISTVALTVSADATGCPADATAALAPRLTRPAAFLTSGVYTQTVTVTNTTGAPISGPIQLILNNLSTNAHLMTGSATATCPGSIGSPIVTLASGSLAPGASLSAVLAFSNTGVPSTAITYTPSIVVGGSRI